MFRRITFALIAAFALAAMTAPATVARSRKTCASRRSTTLRNVGQVRVYQLNDNVSACFRPTRRRTFMGVDDSVYQLLTVYAIAGSEVAYGKVHIPECKADCPPGVTGSNDFIVLDARTGQSRRIGAEPVATNVALTPAGTVAYLEPAAGGGYSLIANGAGGMRVLDTGAILPESIVLSGSTLRWTNAGQPKSATLT